MSTTPPLLGVRVLLVDDEPDTRELYEFALQIAGADVRTASDAQAAMDILQRWSPTILVSDVAMPQTNGLAMLREIRSLPKMRNVPAIALTGMARLEDRNAALAAGFQEHAAKPLGPDELIVLVQRWASYVPS